MKTLQEQYILIKEGKGNKDHFLKQAKNLFPEYINQYSSYDSTVSVLKSKSILSEGIGGVISHKPSPSWLEIFRENTNNEAVDISLTSESPLGKVLGYITRNGGEELLKSKNITSTKELLNALTLGKLKIADLNIVVMADKQKLTDTPLWTQDIVPLIKKAKIDYVFNFWKDKSREFTKDVKPMMDKMDMAKDEQDEVDLMLFDYEREQDDDVDKVMDDTDIEDMINEVIGVPNRKTYGDYDEFAKPSKQVQKDLADQYNTEDKKNIDNVYGTSFLNGYYAEMKDPKNKTKTVDELKQIVLKNMVKDINYYAKNAMFGTKGVGFKTEKLTIAPKGKYKSSGYGDLPKAKTIKESIHDLDILLRPLSNPDITPLKRSPEELGKEADNRSENMLLMKYQKQINDRNITDDELRDILSGQGVKGFGGRKNAIEKIISNRNTN
jgi:hypothetical protein